MLYKSKLKDSGHLLVGAVGKGGDPGSLEETELDLFSAFWCVHTPGQCDCSEEVRGTPASQALHLGHSLSILPPGDTGAL